MSFRCGKCGKPQESGAKPNRTVTKTRTARYHRSENQRSIHDITFGTEIVEETDLCDHCAGKI